MPPQCVAPATIGVMGTSFRIISPSEAGPLQADPGEYIPRAPLGPFRPMMERLRSHAAVWHPQGSDEFVMELADGGGYARLRLITPRWYELIGDARRLETRGGPGSYDAVRRADDAYVPRDDEDVGEVLVNRSDYRDVAFIADCVAPAPGSAVIFDCQLDEMVTPDEWRGRYPRATGGLDWEKEEESEG